MLLIYAYYFLLYMVSISKKIILFLLLVTSNVQNTICSELLVRKINISKYMLFFLAGAQQPFRTIALRESSMVPII